MADIPSLLHDFHSLEDSAQGNSFLHRLHPLAKLLALALFMLTTTSFHKYDLPGLTSMLLPLTALFLTANLSLHTCLHRLRFLLPCLLLLGIANPFLDRAPFAQLGPLTLSHGLISMLTLTLKGTFCLAASYAFILTTRIEPLCAALQRIHVPEPLTTLLLLTHRYLTVLLQEVNTLLEAYHLRVPKAHGIHPRAWGSFSGQLLLRSMDRAHDLYHAMLLRGFQGTFPASIAPRWHLRDTLFLTLSIATLTTLRSFNLANTLAHLFTP